MFNEEAVKLLLTYSWSFPILQYAGICLNKPLAIVVDDACSQHAVAMALSDSYSMYGLSNKETVIQKIQDSEILPAVFLAPNADYLGKRVKEALYLIQEVTRVATLNNKRICVPVIWVFDRHVPNEFGNSFFCVPLHGQIDNWSQEIVLYRDKLIHSARDISFGHEQAVEIIRKRIDESPSYAAFAVSIDIASTVIPELQVENMISLAKTLCIWDEESEDIDDVMEFFLKALYQAVSNGLIKKVNYLPNLDEIQIMNKDDAVYINDKHIFISERLFASIVKDMLSIFPIDVIKRSLRDVGVIVSDKSTFTSKMTYITAFGVAQRMRMIRFDKTAVNIVGDIPFVDLCKIKTE